MQKVSEEYAKSMKKPIRDRGYIKVSFGVINHKAQSSASVDNSGNFTYFTNNERIFDSQIRKEQYATFEENFTKIDGTMYFLPRENSGLDYYDVGLVGGSLVSDGNFEVLINLNISPLEIKGLTINFGDNYPTSFDIVHGGGTINVVNNTNSKWETQDVIGPTNYIRIIVYAMKNPKSRLRINSILFGYGLVYDNEQVIDSDLTSYVSAIGGYVPQIDFTVTLNNYDHYFNVDEPSSAINYLETGQDINVQYGYEIVEEGEPTRIEWIQGANLKCSSWEATDTTATIRAQDILRSMDSEYYKGKYYENGISFYDLALDVLRDAGETGFYIDPKLRTLYTKNPLPRVRHKEALQIIANACRCTLFQTREGGISIKSNFKPVVSISSNGETSYSDVVAISNKSEKKEYASFETNYSRVDRTMYFLPRSGAREINTGYVSSYQSDANGEFSTNPTLTLVQDVKHSYYSLRIVFGYSLPSEFIIRTYSDNSLVDTVLFPNNDYPKITKDMYIIHRFDDFDRMEIEFVKTKEPNNRIKVNYISFEDTVNFTMELNDILGATRAIKQERIQEVVVPCYIYQSTGEETNLFSQTIDIQDAQTMKFFFYDPCYDFVAKIDGGTSGVQIIQSGAYYVEVNITVQGQHLLEIFGHKYKVVQIDTIEKLYEYGQEGVTKKWSNPLISDIDMAQDLVEWLVDYYKTVVEYEYDMRGYPELDVNDIIHHERKTKDGVKIVDTVIYRHSIKFNQAFSGKISARRKEVS